MFEQLIQGPASEPVSVVDQAAFSWFDPPDELTGSPPATNPDYTLVLSQIKTSREEIERLTRFCLMKQTWKLTLPGFPNRRPVFGYPVSPYPFGQPEQDAIELVRHPVQSIQSVKYLDPTGVEQTLDESIYELANDSIVLQIGQVWPFAARRDDAVRVIYTAGYDPSASPPNPTPERLITAVKFLAGWYHENRLPASTQPTQDVMFTVTNLLRGFRSGYLPRVNTLGGYFPWR